MAQVSGRQVSVYFVKSIPWLLMAWRRKGQKTSAKIPTLVICEYSSFRIGSDICLPWSERMPICSYIVFISCRRSVQTLTHWGRDKMAAIFQTILSNHFFRMKMFEFRLRFHWNLFPGPQFTIFNHWSRQWLGAGQATSHYLNQWWLVYWRIYTSLGLNELSCNWNVWHISTLDLVTCI